MCCFLGPLSFDWGPGYVRRGFFLSSCFLVSGGWGGGACPLVVCFCYCFASCFSLNYNKVNIKKKLRRKVITETKYKWIGTPHPIHRKLKSKRTEKNHDGHNQDPYQRTTAPKKHHTRHPQYTRRYSIR